MAADVGSLFRVLGNCVDDHNHRRRHRNQTAGIESGVVGESTALITRDFLGGSSPCVRVEAQELDLDLEVPSGYEKRLDLKTGKVYLQKCNSPTSPTSPNQTVPKFQDLNFPPSSLNPALAPIEEPSVELKLFPSPSSSSHNYQSVCTLDKVKFALERAEKQSTKKARSKSRSRSYSSCSAKETDECSEEKCMSESAPAGLLFAAGCPSCLLYVLISKSNPKCPRCHTTVPSPATVSKKPRLDLNISA